MDLFGRKKLKQRIEALEQQLSDQQESFEEEKERLQKKLEKTEERASNAAAAKQKAEKELNKAKDRIRSLEDLLDQDDADQATTSETTSVSLPTVISLLDNIDRLEFKSAHATSLYIPQSENWFEPPAAVFTDPHLLRIGLLSPLPLRSKTHRASSFDIQPLLDTINQRFCLIHCSAGGSGAAIIEDQDIQDATVVPSAIKSKHTKGGYSQDRFQRLRDDQIHEHVDKLVDAVQPLLDAGFDQLILCGNDQMQDVFAEQLNHPFISLGSDTARIEEQDDLQDSLNSALSFQLAHLTPRDMEHVRSRLDS